jgi:hypothetical protein
MSTLDPMTHFASVSATGMGALMAAWLAWRLWRRLLRAVVACVVVGLVVYLMFPGSVQQLVRDERAPVTSDTGAH